MSSQQNPPADPLADLKKGLEERIGAADKKIDGNTADIVTAKEQIDVLGKGLKASDERIAGQFTEVGTRIDGVDKRIDEFGTAVNGRFDEVATALGGIRQDGTRLGNQMDGFDGRLKDTDGRVVRLQDTVTQSRHLSAMAWVALIALLAGILAIVYFASQAFANTAPNTATVAQPSGSVPVNPSTTPPSTSTASTPPASSGQSNGGSTTTVTPPAATPSQPQVIIVQTPPTAPAPASPPAAQNPNYDGRFGAIEKRLDGHDLAISDLQADGKDYASDLNDIQGRLAKLNEATQPTPAVVLPAPTSPVSQADIDACVALVQRCVRHASNGASSNIDVAVRNVHTYPFYANVKGASHDSLVKTCTDRGVNHDFADTLLKRFGL